MPTYVYACTQCPHGFEKVQSFSDDALTTCPECSGRLRKVFNNVGVTFKGSGFYRTDSRSDSSAKSSASASSGSGSSAASSKPSPASSGSTGSGGSKTASASA